MSWGAWLCYAARAYGISPDLFWRLSLREWRWLTASDEAPPLSHIDLAALMKAYPDRGEAHD